MGSTEELDFGLGGSGTCSDANCDRELELALNLKVFRFGQLASGDRVPSNYPHGYRSNWRTWSGRKLGLLRTVMIMGFALIAAGGMISWFSLSASLFRTHWFSSKPSCSKSVGLNNLPITTSHGHIDAFLSNGTHEFKKTVLLVSLDGVRADYLARGLTPHLLGFSKKGIRAEYMKPIFPTVTFPNHWSILTGLYAESHGIVGNDFWDSKLQSEFDITKFNTTFVPDFYDGEPIWETTSKAGLISANLMWPGPTNMKSGAAPDYFVRMKGDASREEKLDQILWWIDLPIERRPQLILAYEPSVDGNGHQHGPFSREVNENLVQIDLFASRLSTELQARNLSDIIDVLFVSDHGMADMTSAEVVYLEDIIGEEGVKHVKHFDGWPSLGLHFSSKANVSQYISLLLNASKDSKPPKFDVYTPGTFPSRYHISNNHRITDADVYVVPKVGQVVTRRVGGPELPNGSHGFDNDELAMRAIFLAHGPFATSVHENEKSTNSRSHGTSSDKELETIISPFGNVEVYNLLTKLLGIEEWAAKNNGTNDFWDM